MWTDEETWKSLPDRFGHYEYPPFQHRKSDSPALDQLDSVSREREPENIRSLISDVLTGPEMQGPPPFYFHITERSD